MAEAEEFEYIIEFEPYYLENAEHELCFKSRHAERLVRCKDCKYRNTDKYGSWCLNDYEHNLKDDDFCSRGKRK